MPVILRIGPYQFFFYAGDRREPVHIHVRRDRKEVKYWLTPVRFERNRGFSGRELRRIERLVQMHKQTLIEQWNDYFGD